MEEIVSNINKVMKQTEEYIYTQFEAICMEEKYTHKDIEDFINRFNIDVNYEEGYYLNLICKRNDLELLMIFLKYGADFHAHDECVLKMCALHGRLEMVKVLLNHCKCDHKVLYGTNAYNNYDCIKNILMLIIMIYYNLLLYLI